METFIAENRTNLLDLWHFYGARKQNGLWFSTGWPYRVWHDSLDAEQTLNGLQSNQLDLNQQLVMLNPPITGYEIAPEGLKADVRLTLMHLLVPDSRQALADGTDLEFLRGEDDSGIHAFMQMCSEGFGYAMEVAPLQRAARQEGVRLGFLRVQCKRMATVLLYQKGTTLGVFQVAVPGIHRGNGYATDVMLHCIQWAQDQGIELITLQASEMGLNLYRRLGFQEAGSMTFWRI